MIKNTILAIAMLLLVPGLAAQDNSVLREEIRKLDMAHAEAIFSNSLSHG